MFQKIQQTHSKKDRPVRILQFGEGNFLRGFADDIIDRANEAGVFDGSVVLVRPRSRGGMADFSEQNCLYTVSLRGSGNGKKIIEDRVITCIADATDTIDGYARYASYAESETMRFVISNTTEAGIAWDGSDSFELTPPRSFPGKLTKFLYEQCVHFGYDTGRGLIILPAELIENNGSLLKEYVCRMARLWKLEEAFSAWIEQSCIFCNTLVDRIVSGYPENETEYYSHLGYEDRLAVTAEPFALWVIESTADIRNELPFDKAGLPVVFTENCAPYRERKVRILNGTHSCMTPVSYLAGNDTVLESMEDPAVRAFAEAVVFQEIIPSLNIPAGGLKDFARSVFERFRNPFIRHPLLSISLNSVSKWKSRCLPVLEERIRSGSGVPGGLAFSLAALTAFYAGSVYENGRLSGFRGGEKYEIRDSAEVLAFFAGNGQKAPETLVPLFLSDARFWGTDLTQLPELAETVTGRLTDIRSLGMRAALERQAAL